MRGPGAAFTVSVLVGSAIIASGRASAHGGHGSGAAVTSETAAALAVAGGLAAGLGIVAYSRGRSVRAADRVDAAVGVLLPIAGASIAVPAMVAAPVVAPVALAGGLVGRAVPVHVHDGRDPVLALGCVALHRVVEGVALGAATVVGSPVGLAGAALLVGHTAVESAGVGGLYASDRRRAVLAVGGVHVVFALGTGLGALTSIAVPPTTQYAVLAFVGGSLLIVGVTGDGGQARGWLSDRLRPG